MSYEKEFKFAKQVSDVFTGIVIMSIIFSVCFGMAFGQSVIYSGIRTFIIGEIIFSIITMFSIYVVIKFEIRAERIAKYIEEIEMITH